jgi:hypothetical protein
MADIFNAAGKIGGVFKGTTVALTLGGAGIKGALVQNININYSRNVSRIWELGSDDTYYVIGHTEGQAQMSRIVSKNDGDILDALADACEAKGKILSMSGTADTCEGEGNFGIKMSGPMLISRSFAVDAQQFMITSQAGIMFSGLEKSAA